MFPRLRTRIVSQKNFTSNKVRTASSFQSSNVSGFLVAMVLSSRLLVQIFLYVWILCTTFFSASGFYTQSGRYEELGRLGNPCHPRDTCQSLNGIAEDNLWRNRTCECGDHCVRHQTCCIDSNYFGVQQFAPKPSLEMCQKVQTRDLMVYMVSTCSQDWQKNDIFSKCANPDIGLKDPLSEVPVTSVASMTTYRNFFCAVCNYDATSAVFWNIEMKLPNNALMGTDDILARLEYNSKENSWGFLQVDPLTRKQQFKNIPIKFSEKEDMKKYIKPCHFRLVSTCSHFYRSTRLRYKCQAYYSPVEARKRGTTEFSKYRNIHCALCNGLKANIDEFVCLLKTNIRKAPSLSFTKLLDVNTKDGDFVGKLSVCKEGQMYDPFFKKCRSMGCAMPNHVVKNGACVKSE